MIDLKSVRPLDAIIALVVVLVIGLGAFLGYSVWSGNRAVIDSTPASRAIQQLEANVRGNRNNLNARMELAQALVVAGRDREAVPQYEAALKIQKDFAPAISGLGFVALKRKDWAQGERNFRKVVDLLEPKQVAGGNPSLETAYFYLGTALMEQRKYEDAIGYLKRAILLRRDASDTHYALAVCYRSIDSQSKYREELETTLLFDPKMPEANYDYGKVLLAAGDKAGAAEHFRISIDSAPGNELPQDALDALGSFDEHFAAALRVKAEPKAALVEARIAAAVDSRSVKAVSLVGDLYARLGNKTKAATAYRRALLLDPNNSSAKAGLKKVSDAK